VGAAQLLSKTQSVTVKGSAALSPVCCASTEVEVLSCMRLVAAIQMHQAHRSTPSCLVLRSFCLYHPALPC
jgi:hypothetical protein